MNKEYVTWLGGPSINSFGRPQQMISCRQVGEDDCQIQNGGMILVKRAQSNRATAVVLTLRNWWITPKTLDEIESVQAISSRREELLCGKSEARYQSGWWITKCSTVDDVLFQNIQSEFAS